MDERGVKTTRDENERSRAAMLKRLPETVFRLLSTQVLRHHLKGSKPMHETALL